MLQASSQVVVGLENPDCPAICASRLVTAYISAAGHIGSDLTAGHPLPVVSTERFSGTVYVFDQPVWQPPCKTIYLRAAELLNHFMMHSFRVDGSQNISDRGGGGQDHEDWWLEDGVDSIVQNRGHL